MNCSDLLLFPEYSYESFPFIIARAKLNLYLVNVRSRQTYDLLQEQKPNFDNEFSAITSKGKMDSGGTVDIIFSSTK